MFELVVRLLAMLCASLLLAASALAGVTVKRSAEKPRTFDVHADAPLSEVVGALQLYLSQRVDLALDSDPVVTYHASAISAETALRQVVAKAGMIVETGSETLVIRDPAEPAVTLDVKDEEARVILRSMQSQCGIKNLIIDPEVKVSGTFLFHDVPCRTAFEVVLATLGLDADHYPNSVLLVSRRP